MATFLSDTYTDTAGVLLQNHTGETGALWTKHPNAGSDALITTGGRLRATSGTAALYYASGVPATAEYDVEAPFFVASVPSTTLDGIAGRLSTSVNTLYLARYNNTGFQWELLKLVAGTATVLATFAQALTVSQTYTVKLQIRDAAKKLFIDGVERISSADNAITAAGRAGVRMADNGGGDAAGLQLASITGADADTSVHRSVVLSGGGSATIVTHVAGVTFPAVAVVEARTVEVPLVEVR